MRAPQIFESGTSKASMKAPPKRKGNDDLTTHRLHLVHASMKVSVENREIPSSSRFTDG